jgi:hypothetical protein
MKSEWKYNLKIWGMYFLTCHLEGLSHKIKSKIYNLKIFWSRKNQMLRKKVQLILKSCLSLVNKKMASIWVAQLKII